MFAATAQLVTLSDGRVLVADGTHNIVTLLDSTLTSRCGRGPPGWNSVVPFTQLACSAAHH